MLAQSFGSWTLIIILASPGWAAPVEEAAPLDAKGGCPQCRNDSVEICLLYTSPSPRDGLLSRMPSSA